MHKIHFYLIIHYVHSVQIIHYFYTLFKWYALNSNYYLIKHDVVCTLCCIIHYLNCAHNV